MHWAAEFIGLPWSPEGEGPATYSCWGLVRKVFLVRHQIVMPMIAMDTDENFLALSQAARVSGWRPVADLPLAEDIVLMANRRGERHVGVIVFANSSLRVLHSDGEVHKDGSVTGSVTSQTLKDATSSGYGHYEFWRRV